MEKMMQGENLSSSVPVDNKGPVQNMDKNELLLKLYESAIRNVKQAIVDIDCGHVQPDDLLTLGKAYWILEYFIDALDWELAPELCRDLENLYHNMMSRMTQAYTEMSSEPLHAVVDSLTELHQTWTEAVALSPASGPVPKA